MKNRTAYYELYLDGEYWGKYEMRVRAVKDSNYHARRTGKTCLVLDRKMDGSLTGSFDQDVTTVDRTVSDAGFNRWMGR